VAEGRGRMRGHFATNRGTARGQEVARNCGDAANATASTGIAWVSSWLAGCPSRAFCIPGPTSASPLPIRVKSRRRQRGAVRIWAGGAGVTGIPTASHRFSEALKGRH
jgi:hypothetical protein